MNCAPSDCTEDKTRKSDGSCTVPIAQFTAKMAHSIKRSRSSIYPAKRSYRNHGIRLIDFLTRQANCVTAVIQSNLHVMFLYSDKYFSRASGYVRDISVPDGNPCDIVGLFVTLFIFIGGMALSCNKQVFKDRFSAKREVYKNIVLT